jgi:hypothetical protein
MKKINIDVSNVFSKMHSEWNGESHNGNGKKFFNSKKKEVLKVVADRIDSLELVNEMTKIEIDVNERMVSVYYEWDEKENVQEWNSKANKDVRTILNYFWSKGVTAYI